MEQPAVSEREGFELKKTSFVAPPDTSMMDPESKRKVTICNLFLNHNQSLADIVRLLDESYPRVVNVLIEKGILRDRRMNRPAKVPVERRRSHLKIIS